VERTKGRTGDCVFCTLYALWDAVDDMVEKRHVALLEEGGGRDGNQGGVGTGEIPGHMVPRDWLARPAFNTRICAVAAFISCLCKL
jgi:hypothetical protein